MSEMINNREYRQKVLRELITELHNGKGVEEVKPRFEKLIQGISAKEISEMEQALIMDGMPVEEIQKLCDVHAAVFKGSIEEIHRPQKPEEIPGHPIHTFQLENRELEKLVNRIIPFLEKVQITDNKEDIVALREEINQLWEIDKHYSRKENLLFPFMEQYGITAPPKVMWGVDDEIRVSIKELRKHFSTDLILNDEVIDKIKQVCNRVNEMIFKEENILFPMVLETLSEDEWVQISDASDEIGYTLIEPKGTWKPVKIDIKEKALEQEEQVINQGYITLDAGILTPEEINAMLNTLPLDITFVDKDGAVKYFTQGKERIFARPKTILGRQVQNCHPPASMHIVEKIVEDLTSGKKDHEDFWIKMNDKFVYIRYYAVRNEQGEYLGTMEVTQDIKPIQEISGEKRLLSDH